MITVHALYEDGLVWEFGDYDDYQSFIERLEELQGDSSDFAHVFEEMHSKSTLESILIYSKPRRTFIHKNAEDVQEDVDRKRIDMNAEEKAWNQHTRSGWGM